MLWGVWRQRATPAPALPVGAGAGWAGEQRGAGLGALGGRGQGPAAAAMETPSRFQRGRARHQLGRSLGSRRDLPGGTRPQFQKGVN